MSNRGSVWRKWDLHIHSPFSHGTSNRYNEISIKDFCTRIIENNISVIGLTNYFYITENEYNQVVDNLNSDCYVIPNIEFRASDKNKKGDHINFHILFNPNIGINKINISLSKVNLHNYSNKYCCENDITEIGIDTVCIDFEKLLDQLNKDFKMIKDFIIICPFHGHGGFRNDEKPRNTDTEKKYDYFTHAIFGNNNVKDYFLEDRIYNISENETVIDVKKPVFQCSDAHHIDEINKYTWIKADPTFKGLVQALYEPERVSIQATKPEEKDERLIIDEVKFISPNLFTDKPIKFNQNLNVIIGGKSTGKSILLYCIAKTLLTERELGEERYTFSNLDFEISIVSGSNKLMSDTGQSILPQIKYIRQNELIELVKESKKQGSRKLLHKLRSLLFEDSIRVQDDNLITDTSKNPYDEFVNKLQENDKIRETLIDEFFNLKKELETLNTSKSKLRKKDAIDDSIKHIENKINNAKSKLGLTDEDLNKYEEKNKSLEKIKNDIINLRKDYNLVNETNNQIRNNLETALNLTQDCLNELTNERIKEFIIEKYLNIGRALDDINTLITQIILDENNQFREDNIFKTIHLENVNNKRILEEDIKPYLTDKELRSEIEISEKQLSEDKKALNELNELVKKITEKEELITVHKNKIFSLYEENYNLYMEFYAETKDVTDLKDELQIEGITRFDFPKFREQVQKHFDWRDSKIKGYNIFNSYKTRMSECFFNQIVDDLKSIFDEIVNGKMLIKTNTDAKNAISALLYDYFFDHWELTYEGDNFARMSEGKASFVLLKLMIELSKAKAPILIDQPEDDLDNKSISMELVNYLRDKKKERQIILVSHNANVVVNADAENIIVAQQLGAGELDEENKFTFDYINGSIENSKTFNQNIKRRLEQRGIREHVIDIVEGTERAFKEREKKYGFNIKN